MGDLATLREQQAPAAVSSNPMEMMATAIQNGATPEMLERLMELQERWQGNEARRAFNEAMADARSKIGPIYKSQKVDFTSQKGRTHYQHEDLAGIARQVDSVLSEYGLSYRYRTNQEGDRVTVTCVVIHSQGHSEETSLASRVDESGNKNHIQAIGSAVTYLQRYTLKAALGLSASKDDDGHATERPADKTITEEQIIELRNLIQCAGRTEDQAITWLNSMDWRIEGLGDIKATAFDGLVTKLKGMAK